MIIIILLLVIIVGGYNYTISNTKSSGLAASSPTTSSPTTSGTTTSSPTTSSPTTSRPLTSGATSNPAALTQVQWHYRAFKNEIRPPGTPYIHSVPAGLIEATLHSKASNSTNISTCPRHTISQLTYDPTVIREGTRVSTNYEWDCNTCPNSFTYEELGRAGGIQLAVCYPSS